MTSISSSGLTRAATRHACDLHSSPRTTAGGSRNPDPGSTSTTFGRRRPDSAHRHCLRGCWAMPADPLFARELRDRELSERRRPAPRAWASRRGRTVSASGPRPTGQGWTGSSRHSSPRASGRTCPSRGAVGSWRWLAPGPEHRPARRRSRPLTRQARAVAPVRRAIPPPTSPPRAAAPDWPKRPRLRVHLVLGAAPPPATRRTRSHVVSGAKGPRFSAQDAARTHCEVAARGGQRRCTNHLRNRAPAALPAAAPPAAWAPSAGAHVPGAHVPSALAGQGSGSSRVRPARAPGRAEAQRPSRIPGAGQAPAAGQGPEQASRQAEPLGRLLVADGPAQALGPCAQRPGHPGRSGPPLSRRPEPAGAHRGEPETPACAARPGRGQYAGSPSSTMGDATAPWQGRAVAATRAETQAAELGSGHSPDPASASTPPPSSLASRSHRVTSTS